MEAISRYEIDLFAEKLPSLGEIEKLSNWVHSSQVFKEAFALQVEQNSNDKSAALRVGIGLYILAKYPKAEEKLMSAPDTMEKFFFLGRVLRAQRKFAPAVENFDKAIEAGGEKFAVTLEKVDTLRRSGDLEAAGKELETLSNFANVNADYHYHLGRLQEDNGNYGKAMDSYSEACELNPQHQKAIFRLAYRSDLAGDTEAAIDYYREAASMQPTHVNALLNLAVLYEDAGRFDKAGACVDLVLDTFPDHPRAMLFAKDIESSKNMYIDEEKERRKSRKYQILETPISDFELSVRSRNCLKKMRINTLGDLLNTSEAELLSYKNFGETSLREIKTILEPRGLHLGQTLEEKQALIAEVTKEAEPDDGINRELLGKTIDELGLSVRAKKCLQKLNVRTIGEVVSRTEAELLGCKNFGVTSLTEIKNALTNNGLSLRTLD